MQERVKPDVVEPVGTNDGELNQTDLDDSLQLVESEDEDKLESSVLVEKKSKNIFKAVSSVKNNAGYSSTKNVKHVEWIKKVAVVKTRKTQPSKNTRVQVCGDILDNPEVEEHRSNVLGQIIAKGERSV